MDWLWLCLTPHTEGRRPICRCVLPVGMVSVMTRVDQGLAERLLAEKLVSLETLADCQQGDSGPAGRNAGDLSPKPINPPRC